jgi:molybdenum cofactor cytidylyltransferase
MQTLVKKPAEREQRAEEQRSRGKVFAVFGALRSSAPLLLCPSAPLLHRSSALCCSSAHTGDWLLSVLKPIIPAIMPVPGISAILLAAGESRRMQAFKQLLPLRGKSFVEHCVDSLLASEAFELIVVTGHNHELVEAALAGRPVNVAYNSNFREGMSSSIKRGVIEADPASEALLIALVDQPLIDVLTINALIRGYRETRPLIAVPVYEGRRGHPIILDARLRDEVLNLDPNVGLREVVTRHREETVEIPVGASAILQDFDLPEEYLKLKNTE